ncbi:ComEA family DNA-binding protein [Modestobacter sp. URMC 112]
MRPSARRSDDADVIRARLRAVLAEMGRQPGWVPPDDLLDGDGDPAADRQPGRPGPLLRAPAHHTDDLDHVDGDPDADDPDDGLPGGLGRHRAPGSAARLDPGRPGARALCATALAAAVLVGGWTWADRPEVEPVTAGVAATSPAASPGPSAAPTEPSPAPPSSAVLVVSVVGQVARPGLVTLPVGSRVADALTAAGGLLPEADPAAVNAAALLTDGQQVAVGVPGAPAGAPPGTGGAGTGLLDLNAATVADLDALPGIGPVLAQRIVDHRATQGPFTSVEQLDDVSGIGPAIYAELAELVTV